VYSRGQLVPSRLFRPSTVLTTKQALLTCVAALLISSSCSDSITDTNPVIASLSITNAPTDSLAVEDSAQLGFTARDASGNVVSRAKVTWTSSDEEIAVVSSAGQISATGIGAPVTITATGNGATAAVTLHTKPLTIVLDWSEPIVSLNSKGEGAGGNSEAIRMDADLTIVPLQSPSFARALSINDSGDVVGTFESGSQNRIARWVGGEFEDLGVLAAQEAYNTATSTNNQRAVVGYGNIEPQWSGAVVQKIHGFVWTAQAGLQHVSMDGKVETKVWDINDAGDIVGTVGDAITTRGFIRKAGETTLHDIGSLGGGVTRALAINSSRQVVGQSLNQAQVPHAFVWTESGGFINLGTLTGASASVARDINDLGEIVGNTGEYGCCYGAFLWTQKRGVVHLPDGTVYSINLDGVIAASTDQGAVLWVTRRRAK
jgi:probable HAF family extracellular repeat protein